MKETPIVMTGDHPRKIIELLKTQTRRTTGLKEINKNPDDWECGAVVAGRVRFYNHETGSGIDIKCPYGEVGDVLRVKETFMFKKGADCREQYVGTDEEGMLGKPPHYAYRADQCLENEPDYGSMFKWRSSRFMPRKASRLWLEIEDERCERVKNISAYDALMEGVLLPVPFGCEIHEPPKDFNNWTKFKQESWIEGQARATYFARTIDAEDHIKAYLTLWDNLYSKSGEGTDLNPWVWAITFNIIHLISEDIDWMGE